MATLVGLILTFILLRAWMFGDLFSLVNAIGFKMSGYAAPTGDFATPESMGSVSYIFVAFIANAIYGVGQFAILAWSGLGWIINDLVTGYRQWAAERLANPADSVGMPDFSELAVKPSVTAKQPVNVRVVEPDPMEQILGQFQDNLLSLQEMVIELSNKVDSLPVIKPPPATRTTTRARAKA